MPYNSRHGRTSARGARFNNKRPNQRKNNRKQNSTIHHSRFIKAATTVASTETYVPKHKFDDFNLAKLLKTNLLTQNLTIPSPIQDQSIPVALQGKDVIGLASTGTGKTVAFILPLLHRLITQKAGGALIIAPTRELAMQIEQECKKLSKNSGLFSALLIGGSSMGRQLRDLRNRPRIVIGTPGRIKDHTQRGTLKLENFSIVVLDEVDRMLDMGFINDITNILSLTRNDRQSLFFSATMDKRVGNLINNFTNEPVTVSIKASSASENVNQDVVRYQTSSDKMTSLFGLLSKKEVSKAIIFDETQRGVERLNKKLLDQGFSTDAIHGGKTQGQRQRALRRFKENDIKVLVATDVAARGIDVIDISHVVNFSPPKLYDDYIHRIGRTGRAGKVGHALTFVNH